MRKPLGPFWCYLGLLAWFTWSSGASAHLCMYCLMGAEGASGSQATYTGEPGGWDMASQAHRNSKASTLPACGRIPRSMPSCFLASRWRGPSGQAERECPLVTFVGEFLDLSISLACAAGSSGIVKWVVRL